MDLITLDANNHQSKLIENYDSLIWTERYSVMGDFQLMTGNVEEYLELLPEGTVVSLRETAVPMIVERHQIDRKKNQGAMLTIKGREYTSILDRRVSIQGVGAALGDWKVVAKIPSDVAHYIIYKICVEGILDPNDIFPPSQVQFITPKDYLTSSGPNRQFSVPRGKLLTTVLGLIDAEAVPDGSTTPPTPELFPHGIKCMRPSISGTAIGIEIYVGTDRSDKVVFDAARDVLDDGTYLLSKEGSANHAYILGPNGAFRMNKGDVIKSGLERRVMLVDGTTSGIDNNDALHAEGSRTLAQAHETAMFDGSVNQDLSPYVFNVDYHLGDIVKSVGDYGLDTKSRVTEYIRSEDATGSKSYPTLEAIRPEGSVFRRPHREYMP